MRSCLRLVRFACLTMLALDGAAIAADPPIDVKDVEQVRGACFVGCLEDERPAKNIHYLVRMGEKVFPAYEAILSDPKATPDEIGVVFGILCSMEADRRRFAKHAVSHLADAKFGARLNAVCLLGEIGSAAEASPLIALLSDERSEVVGRAAWTLAAIGGPNELAAMDVWLRGVTYRNNTDIRDGVQYHRNELKKRLDEAKDPTKQAQLRWRWWTDLRNTEEALEARYAVRELTARGDDTVAFLKDHLHPVSAERQKHLDQLLADLDGDSFERREAATRELSRGIVAESVLRQALANRPSLERRRRLEAILADLPRRETRYPELLRRVRAIWVLQQIGTPEARVLLEKLAAGAPSARQTLKAKDALQSLDRLKKR